MLFFLFASHLEADLAVMAADVAADLEAYALAPAYLGTRVGAKPVIAADLRSRAEGCALTAAELAFHMGTEAVIAPDLGFGAQSDPLLQSGMALSLHLNAVFAAEIAFGFELEAFCFVIQVRPSLDVQTVFLRADVAADLVAYAMFVDLGFCLEAGAVFAANFDLKLFIFTPVWLFSGLAFSGSTCSAWTFSAFTSAGCVSVSGWSLI